MTDTCKMYYCGDPKAPENPLRVCGSCGASQIDSEYYDGQSHRAFMKYCPECGKRVTWDERFGQIEYAI